MRHDVKACFSEKGRPMKRKRFGKELTANAALEALKGQRTEIELAQESQ
jgi:hypothetical protein